MDTENWETVTRKERRRSPTPTTVTQNDRRSRSRSPRSSAYRNQSCSPPPERMPSPKAQSKPVTGRHGSKKPRRQFHDPDFPVSWQAECAFSLQPKKKEWQERLVQSTERPRRAEVAIIKAGVHISPDDPDRVQHLTVEYQRDSGEHVTTWHLDLTEVEYQSFKEIERPNPATSAVEPLPCPAMDNAALTPPPSP